MSLYNLSLVKTAPTPSAGVMKPPSRPASRLSMMAEKRKSLAPKSATPKISRDPSLEKKAKTSPPKESSPKPAAEKQPSPAKEPERVEAPKLQNSSPPKSSSSIQSLQEITEQQSKIAELEKENAELQASVKDWKDKTDLLVAKRRQDREALKDAERNRIQLQVSIIL